MNSFEKKIMTYIEEQSMIERGDRVLAACSGGVDSVALLLFLTAHKEMLGIEVGAVHVDHMLRGEESQEDGRFVKMISDALGVPFHGGEVPVPDIIRQQGGNVQDVCRKGRYAFFGEVMDRCGYTKLAVAHHAEDQLETVLLQIAKGSPPLGMPAMRDFGNGLLIRPLLPAVKEELRDCVQESGTKWREDPSNASSKYTRNRLRHQAVPPLLGINPKAAVQSVHMTERLREDSALLDSLASEAFAASVGFTEKGFPEVRADQFKSMHPALQRRLIQLLLNHMYDGENIPVDYSAALLESLRRHLCASDGNADLHLPAGVICRRHYGRSVFMQKETEKRQPLQVTLVKNGWTAWNGWRFYWGDAAQPPSDIPQRVEVKYFTLDDPSLPLSVRTRRDGDRLRLSGMEKPKRLSRLFIDEKIEKGLRDKTPVIMTAGGDVCAVPGIRYGALFSDDANRGKYIFIASRA